MKHFKDDTLIYLACPFWHEDRDIRRQRYYMATQCAAKLISDGITVFSPLTHGYHLDMAMELNKYKKLENETWTELAMMILKRCDVMFILTLKGWQDSQGINMEVELATRLMKPVFLVDKDFVVNKAYKLGFSPINNQGDYVFKAQLQQNPYEPPLHGDNGTIKVGTLEDWEKNKEEFTETRIKRFTFDPDSETLKIDNKE